MRSLALITVLFVAGIAVCYAEEKYTTQYDKIDIDEILNSDRLLNNYMNCLLDRGKCTPAGNELKKNLPDGLENECSRCSEKQKELGKKVLKFLIEQKRELFDQLEAKYDPDGHYRKKYQESLEKEGIKL